MADTLVTMENTLRVQRALKGKDGVTQFTVARAVRIDANRYWRIEHDRTEPTEAEIKALARYFRCEASALFPSLSSKPTPDGVVA